jgi:hypothetical protein
MRKLSEYVKTYKEDKITEKEKMIIESIENYKKTTILTKKTNAYKCYTIAGFHMVCFHFVKLYLSADNSARF